MKKIAKHRDPNWRWMRALGHKVVKDKTLYSRKLKHKDKKYVPSGEQDQQQVC
jgi:hypothetical protein